ncbi:tail tape measure protein [Pseudomonas fluorescens ABAC62]|nr:tail tape measure protein [Pseudomonas fluorescens ABAC62]
MQETQFATRLAQEDKPWLLGDADLGNVLAAFSADLAAPASLDSPPQAAPQSQLTTALVSVSVDINALAQEQVRLRETLESLNTTLFIRESALATHTQETSAAVAASELKKPEPANRSWTDQGLEMGADAAKFVGKELLSGLWDKAKDRLSGNAIDAVADKFPTAAKWLKDGKDKDKDGGTDKACCCTGALPPHIRGPLDTATSQVPESVGETAREKDKTRPKGNTTRPRGKRRKGTKSQSREVKTISVRRLADLQSKRSNPAAKASTLLNVMGQPQARFDSKRVSPAAAGVPGNSLTSYVESSANRSVTRGVGLSGTLARLESSAARRLGPLKYVDTAINVVEGVRNGDANAVGAGLTTAGGAWAGASAGAAIGTLIFPGVGTAVGGAIGGLLGSEAGAWLGDKVFGSSDRLPAPSAVSKELNTARADNVQVTLAPSIQITGVNPADAQQVVNQVIQALQFQCVPMLTDALGVRRNAALADSPGGD